jgi:PPOX class probable F420-dependent enzyme
MRTIMMTADVRRLIDGTPIAHLATIQPDGSPHSVPLWIGTHGDGVAVLTGPGSRKARNLRRDPRVAISLTPAGTTFPPVVLHGRLTGWLEGDDGWAVIDEIARKYTGQPYDRTQERIVALIEITYERIGLV